MSRCFSKKSSLRSFRSSITNYFCLDKFVNLRAAKFVSQLTNYLIAIGLVVLWDYTDRPDLNQGCNGRVRHRLCQESLQHECESLLANAATSLFFVLWLALLFGLTETINDLWFDLLDDFLSFQNGLLVNMLTTTVLSTHRMLTVQW